MKKFLFVLALIFIAAGFAFAAEQSVSHIGVLTYLGTSEQEFQQGLDDLRKAVAPLVPSDNNEVEEPDALESFMISLVQTRRVVHFYDSLMTMQMAMNSRKIYELALPEPVGFYLVNNNNNFEILFSLNMTPSNIAFGFKRGNDKLQKEFNKAIDSMRADGTLNKLAEKYIANFAADHEDVKFSNFKDGQTIKVAVTGDLPPIDYIAPDGRPTGYNTAILAEIGRRLKKNIRLISVDAGGRSAALASDRADVVFWYRSTSGIKSNNKKVGNALGGVMKDSLDSVILSSPYYTWDTDLIIGK